MTAKYSIIQFVPDSIVDERVNIGVTAFNEKEVRVRFLTNWERVRHFADRDITFLKDFAKWMSEAASQGRLLPGMDRSGVLDQEQVTYMSERWMNALQLTTPRASLENVDELVAYISARFLAEPLRKKLNFRTRRAAARAVVAHIRSALSNRIGDEAEELVKKRFTLPGRHQGHRFDAVVTNGVPYFAAHGLSFELPDAKPLENVLDAVAWSIADVKARDPSFPIAIAALPPRKSVGEAEKLQELYTRSLTVYKEIGAEVLAEEEVEGWASRIASRILL